MIRHDATGGLLLVAAATLAMIFANTPASSVYKGILELPVIVVFAAFDIAKPLLLCINDGLMAVFFLMVGLEVEREMLAGHLSSPAKIVLPGLAAVTGIVFRAHQCGFRY